MKYLIDETEYSENEFKSKLEDNLREHIEYNYDDILDESYPEISIGVCTFTASEILKNCDPVAYRCGMQDFLDVDLSDAEYELETSGTFETSSHIYKII